jgi:hypothetical protein
MEHYIKCSEFVKRQTADSGYSHFNGSWYLLEEIVQYIYNYFPQNIRQGYRDGVVLVDLPPYNFYSSIIKIDEDTELVANYAPRVEGEAAFIRICASGEKQPATYASVVLYRHDVLAEDKDRSTDAEWEIIAIKARTSNEEEPMDPYTMARNFLHLKGGTKGDFTAEQFAKSIVYWNHHCMMQGKQRKSFWNKLISLSKKVILKNV